MVFSDLISAIVDEEDALQRIWFAGEFQTPPPFSYQVNFPRVEIVLTGEYLNQIEDQQHHLRHIAATPGDAIFIPANSWNTPNWDTTCSVMSMLFGKRQLGFSFVSKRKEDAHFYDVQKYSVPTRTGYAIDNILEALTSLARERHQQPMDKHLLLALLEYSNTMLQHQVQSEQNRGQDLFQTICIYIQENFHRPITRDSIATRFSLSPNHVSRLFRQKGHMTLADYITWVRIDRAKFMLKKYDLKLHDIAMRCGFKEVNYFCRVFKQRTGRTPSQYRQSV